MTSDILIYMRTWLLCLVALSTAQAGENLIDRYIDAKLAESSAPVSGPANDSEFIRRVHLDLIGRLPEPEVARKFLADPCYLDISVPAGRKRRLKVDVTRNAFAYVFAGSGSFRDPSDPHPVLTEQSPDAAPADTIGNH